jgi:Na+-driven multidrug efflux pump
MEGKAYLIDKSFRFHMGASIMTMTAMNLNSIIDGILMGRLLGSDAFSAINVVLPIVNCISAIGILLSQGAAMKIAKFLGAMDKKKANEVCRLMNRDCGGR